MERLERGDKQAWQMRKYLPTDKRVGQGVALQTRLPLSPSLSCALIASLSCSITEKKNIHSLCLTLFAEDRDSEANQISLLSAQSAHLSAARVRHTAGLQCGLCASQLHPTTLRLSIKVSPSPGSQSLGWHRCQTARQLLNTKPNLSSTLDIVIPARPASTKMISTQPNWSVIIRRR